MATFICYWGAGYAQHGTQTVNETFFTDSNGYDDGAIDRVETLGVGEELDLTEMGQVHVVRRMS